MNVILQSRPHSVTVDDAPWVERIVRSLWIACLLLGNLAGVVTQTPIWAQPSSAPTMFFIETIRLDNVQRAQHDIIITESRLQIGRSYSEAELQQGSHRIVRLPFIVAADVSLERGSEPGKFILVVHLEEAKPWFFALDISGEFLSDDVALTGPEPGSQTGRIVGLVGRQFFLGRTGVLTTALGGESEEYQLQYSQYDLFGRGIGLNIAYRFGLCDESPEQTEDICSSRTPHLGTDPAFSTWNQLGNQVRIFGGLTIPLTSTLSVLVEGDLRLTDDGFKGPVRETDDNRLYRYNDLKQLDLRLAALQTTLDDPIATTSGVRIEVALNHRRTAGDFHLGQTLNPQTSPWATRITESGLSVSLVRYWPMRGYSLFVKGDLFVGKTDWENLPIAGQTTLTSSADALRAELGFGHAIELWRSAKPEKLASLRLETDITADWDGTSPSSSLGEAALPTVIEQSLGEVNPLRSLRVRGALVYRNRRAVVRFSLGYRELFLP